ncbi:MAG: hypothetical protein HYT87_19250 [Nitrospirae bacterium]|nr:hypothetical protein [Nitrospirota bacterium]
MRRVLRPTTLILTAIFMLAGPIASMAAPTTDLCAQSESAGLKATCCEGDCCVANVPQAPSPAALPAVDAQPLAPSAAPHSLAVIELAHPWLGSAPVMIFARSPGRTLSLLQTYLL